MIDTGKDSQILPKSDASYLKNARLGLIKTVSSRIYLVNTSY